MTPDLLLAVVALIGAIASFLNQRNAAKKDVVAILQNEVDRDHERIEKLERERNDLADAKTLLQQERDGLNQKIELLQGRITETENRLARAERCAGESERQAAEFRQDVVRLGEALEKERRENRANVTKLVIIIEKLVKQLKALNIDPDVDIETLRRMYDIERTG